jgi:hypothetical protein
MYWQRFVQMAGSAGSGLSLPLPPTPASLSSGGSGPISLGAAEVSTWAGSGFVLPFEVKWSNSTSVRDLLKGSAAALGRSDFSGPLQVDRRQPTICSSVCSTLTDFLLPRLRSWVQVMERHLIETVGDLRLLLQEGMLRTLGLPVRLCVWLEEELGRVTLSSSSAAAASAQTNTTPRASVMGGAAAASVSGGWAEMKRAVSSGGSGSAGLYFPPPIDFKQSHPKPNETDPQALKRLKVSDMSDGANMALSPAPVSRVFRHSEDFGACSLSCV